MRRGRCRGRFGSHRGHRIEGMGCPDRYELGSVRSIHYAEQGDELAHRAVRVRMVITMRMQRSGNDPDQEEDPHGEGEPRCV